jgi:AcrR family transcriptional regulator
MRRTIDLPPWPEPNPLADPVVLAVAAEVCEGDRGAGGDDPVANRAGISLTEFHRRFANFDACLVDSFERIIAAYEHRIGSAFNAPADWRSGLRAAGYETVAWMEENPLLTEFGVVGVLGVKNEMVRVMREEVLLFCAGMIDLGRDEAPEPGSVPEPAAMIAIGSIFELLAHRLQAQADFDACQVVPEMMYGVVRTYLGDDAAEEELALPPPNPGRASSRSRVDPGSEKDDAHR